MRADLHRPNGAGGRSQRRLLLALPALRRNGGVTMTEGLTQEQRDWWFQYEKLKLAYTEEVIACGNPDLLTDCDAREKALDDLLTARISELEHQNAEYARDLFTVGEALNATQSAVRSAEARAAEYARQLEEAHERAGRLFNELGDMWRLYEAAQSRAVVAERERRERYDSGGLPFCAATV